MAKGRLPIGELAERSGLAHSALRFYEDKGLISSERTTGNQRRYPRHTLRRLAFISAAQRVGLSLGQIREALDGLPEGRTPTVDDWSRLSENWRSELDARIDALQRLRDRLTGCIGCGCLSLKTCGIQNPNDEVFESFGAGSPRLTPAREGGY